MGVALALLASPCLSQALLAGTAPGHVHDASAVLADGHHRAADSAAGHSHLPADGPDRQHCCKLCDASLSGRKDDASKIFAVPRPASPEDEPMALSSAIVWDARPRAHRVLRAPATIHAADTVTGPLYLTTGRFRV